MKNLCFTVVAFSTLFLMSCGQNGTCKLSSKDSIDIYNAMASNQQGIRAGNDTGIYKFYGGDSHSLVITEDRARELHLNYLNGNVLPIQYDGKYIRYFSVPAEDVKKIQDVMGANYGLRIYFGYDTTEKNYHLILTGVNDKGENNMNALFNEFKPCPDQCVTNETDLNFYNGEYAQGYHGK
jgi:hypothetical protein